MPSIEEQRYEDFQNWLNQCPLVVTDYQDFTDLFQITFSLTAVYLLCKQFHFTISHLHQF